MGSRVTRGQGEIFPDIERRGKITPIKPVGRVTPAGKVKLPSPERCRHCGQRGRVIDSRAYAGHRRRRHQCDACNWRWSSYQSVLNPQKVRLKTKNH